MYAYIKLIKYTCFKTDGVTKEKNHKYIYCKCNKSFEQNCSFIIIAAMLDFLYN